MEEIAKRIDSINKELKAKPEAGGPSDINQPSTKEN